MTYNLRSRGSSHGANVVLVDDYLREWRRAQRNYVPKTPTPPARRTKDGTRAVKENETGANRLRVVSECVTPKQNGDASSETPRSARNRCVSDTTHNGHGRRARSTGMTLERFTPRVSSTLRSRSGSKSRRTTLDIDTLSESFTARAKIQKLDYGTQSAKRSLGSQNGYVRSSRTDHGGYTNGSISGSGALSIQGLSEDCKIKIFSYLSALEKGRASMVCREWRDLMCLSMLWSTVDFTEFQLCSRNHTCDKSCYDSYKQRIYAFVQTLHHHRPALRRFCFHYDLGNGEDGWLECIESVVEHANCRELAYVNLNWKETPIRPFWKDAISWSSSQYRNMVYQNRLRQRKFILFFESLVERAPNITHLVLPFDWSYRSVACISRLPKLKVLVLEKYNFFQSPPLAYLEELLKNCTQLEKLVLEIWSPSGKGHCLYRLSSPSISHLDISQSHGFYLQHADLPKLDTFICKRNPHYGSLKSADSTKLPCLYETLVTGAPNLQRLNDHRLRADWRHVIYDELQTLLYAHCCCSIHNNNPSCQV